MNNKMIKIIKRIIKTIFKFLIWFNLLYDLKKYCIVSFDFIILLKNT
jgi:hypothetical protein